MNLADLQKEAHAIAKEKGWWNQERTFGDLIALVHSELSEALEAYREWGLTSSLEILRRTIPPPSYRDEKEKEVECWWILNEETGTFDKWELTEYAALCKPEGVASELADVVIRLADMAEWYGVDLGALVSEQEAGGVTEVTHYRPDTFGDWITELHSCLSSARLAERDEFYDSRRIPDWGHHLAILVRSVQRMAAHYGIDLDTAIEAKLEYNRTRSYRHGGKAL